MASFTIATFSSTARSLVAGETGYIGRTGELVTSGAVAVSVSGSANVIVNGVLASFTNSALASSGAAADLDLLVGSTGEIMSTAASGVRFDAKSAARISNAGTIQSVGEAISLGTSDGGADLSLVNTGTLATTSTASDDASVVMFAGTGDVFLDNAGTIGGTERLLGAVKLNGDVVTLRNSGAISGGVSVIADSAIIANTGSILGAVDMTASGVSSLTNEGTITGDVIGGDGDDVYRGAGSVGRSVSLRAGDDTYIVTRADLVIVEDSFDFGTDEVRTRLDWTLGRGFENLTLIGSSNATGSGNGLGNVIVGNDGDNRLSGRRGDDSLSGGLGDDTLFGGDGNDTFTEIGGDGSIDGGAGTDTLDLPDGSAVVVNLSQRIATAASFSIDLDRIENVVGSGSNDEITGSGVANVLDGGGGADRIAGGKGTDTLIGGAGRDTLTGGTEADRFVVRAITDAPVATPDRITDFVRGEDVIDLSPIDANGAAILDGTFVFVTGITIPLAEGSVQVVQDAAANVTRVNLRIAGDTTIDGVIELTGLRNLTADDFVL